MSDSDYHKYRNIAFSQLGEKCVTCGNEDRRCLQIDHINAVENKTRGHKNGGGRRNTELRRRIKNGENLSKTYQVLCASCHMIKTFAQGDNQTIAIEMENEAIKAQLNLPILGEQF